MVHHHQHDCTGEGMIVQVGMHTENGYIITEDYCIANNFRRVFIFRYFEETFKNQFLLTADL